MSRNIDNSGSHIKRASLGYYTTAGDVELQQYLLRAQTTDGTTATEMFAGDGTGAGTVRMAIESDASYMFEINLMGRRTDVDTGTNVYKIWGGIHNHAGTTSLSVTAYEPWSDEDFAAASYAVTADDTNDSLKIAVTGVTGYTILWSAWVTLVKAKG